MPLPDPTFDPRRYQDVLADALARVPVHNPEWTNLNDADPGVTLLQLFAFMTESLIYRTELIPERNRAKYLRLLGLGLRPAEPARGLVSFSLPGSAADVLTLPAGQLLRAGSVPFCTEGGLSVLPVEARAYYKSPLDEARRAEATAAYEGLYASYLTGEDAAELDFYETRVFAPPESGFVLPTLELAAAQPGTGPVGADGRLTTTDGYVWVALLARRATEADREAARGLLARSLITIGVVAVAGPDGRALGGEAAADPAEAADLVFEVPDLPDPPPAGGDTTPVAAYRALRVTARSGNLLTAPGTVELDLRPPPGRRLGIWEDLDPLEAGVGELPPSLDQLPEQDRLVTWIRVRVVGPTTSGEAGGSSQTDARIQWIGINAAQVTQRALVPVERLGNGTGEPDQLVRLVNSPVIASSLTLTVNGEAWSPIDDIAAAPPEVPVADLASNRTPVDAGDPGVYRLDPESGEIRFGDGVHGRRPPAGALIQASYAYGGGLQGLVGIGAIGRGPAGVKVTNPVPTWGGGPGETVADGERRLPAFIRHGERLVSAEDYRDIVWRTPGVELGRVEPLALLHPDQPEQPAPGVVTLLVVPAQDPRAPSAPSPDTLFLAAVCRWLEPRRVLTTELHVRGPAYLGIVVTVGIESLPGRDQASVREAVRERLTVFLSPLTGGFEGAGWPLGKAVETLELWAEAARVDGVAKINGVLMAETSGAARDSLPLAGLELPHLVGLAVGSGSPPALSTVLGGPVATVPGTRPRLPVPVIPEEC